MKVYKISSFIMCFASMVLASPINANEKIHDTYNLKGSINLTGSTLRDYNIGLLYLKEAMKLRSSHKEKDARVFAKSAMILLLRESEERNKESGNLLGILYLGAFGLPVNHKKAYFYVKQSYEAGSTNAISNLAILNIYGFGVKKNCKVGMSLLKEASKKGNLKAKDMLKKMNDSKGACSLKTMQWSF